MSATRRARLAALAVSTLLAALLAMLLASPARAQDCGVGDLPACVTTTTESTTTTIAPTTTPVGPTTTTFTPRATTTTGRQATSTTAERVQDTTPSTSRDVSTSVDLLVPGDGSQGAESTTTTIETPQMVKDDGASDGTLIATVVVALVVLAFAVSLLTWRYWSATRPPRGATVGSGDG